jgi:hypothetical protein
MLIARKFLGGKLGNDQKRETFRKQDEVETKGYKFQLATEEYYWSGYESGKMEDMPGHFMTNKISLTGYPDSATDYEKIAAKNKLALYKNKKETTFEPAEYAEIYHKALMGEIRSNPKEYLSRVPGKVRDLLEKELER